MKIYASKSQMITSSESKRSAAEAVACKLQAVKKNLDPSQEIHGETMQACSYVDHFRRNLDRFNSGHDDGHFCFKLQALIPRNNKAWLCNIRRAYDICGSLRPPVLIRCQVHHQHLTAVIGGEYVLLLCPKSAFVFLSFRPIIS